MDKQRGVNNRHGIMEDLAYLLAKIGAIILVSMGLLTFVFGVTTMADTGMEPAVMPGDLLFFYRLDKDYVPSDVIALTTDDGTQVRRVVAVAGDTVDMTSEGLMINGALQQEPDTDARTLPYTEGITFPLTVKEGDVFVLGDNREGVSDSRVYGTVQMKDIKGEVIGLVRHRDI